MPCPKCGFESAPTAPECARCGVIFSKLTRETPIIRPYVIEEERVADGRVGREELKVLGLGLSMAILAYALPFTRAVFSLLVTLFHELGHAVMGWAIGYPSIPAFDFVYGGGLTHHGAFQPAIALAIAAGFVYLGWLFRHNKKSLAIVGVIFLVWLFVVTKEWRREVAFAAAGHLSELILAGIFFYKALAGVGWRAPEVERPLGAFAAFFVQIHSMLFAWRLTKDADFLAWYREGKGGALMNDLDVIAADLQIYLGWNPEIAGVAKMLLVFSVVPIAVALVWYFERARWHRVLRALRTAETVLLLAFATIAWGQQPMCGASAEQEEAIRALHARTSKLALPRASSVATVRDGAFYMQADERIAFGGRPFDLGGQSLVFSPRGAGFAVERQPLRYVAPSGDALHDFESRAGSPWHYVAHDLPFPFLVFGRSVTRVYLSAFNGIHLDPPGEERAMVFGALHAAARPDALLSPLMITAGKPRHLAYPRLWVSQTTNLVRITWRSTAGSTFGYDVQAELHRDGRVVFSYASMRNMQWGAPVISPGVSASTPRRMLSGLDDGAGDVSSTFGSLIAVLDIRRAELFRVDDSDLFGVRLLLGGALDLSKLTAGQILRYSATFGDAGFIRIEVTRDGWTVASNGGIPVPNGAEARLLGDTIEMYGLQPPSWDGEGQFFRAFTTTVAPNRTADTVSTIVPFDAPQRRTAIDFSALAQGAEVRPPFAEPFVLPEFDPFEVWSRLQPAFALSDDDIDAVAMYQTFHTDILFYAGAYAIRGNPRVDGIAPTSPLFGRSVPRETGLLHMNQLTYNYNAAEETASKVMLHEFGHRWLYAFRIREGGAVTASLNPLSAHPAAYVDTRSAFPVYGAGESSVMGGGTFTQQGDGSYLARAANMGFSWHELYLMGLAAPEEVQPWFYLAGTSLPSEYWPADGSVVTGEKREVELDQIVAVHGPRNPPAAISQRAFRVLFVLVTEAGRGPTDAEVAKLNEWRALLERNFLLATGGRGRVETEWVRGPRRRGVR